MLEIKKICVLCYADDIVCLTETTKELQTMLNIIHSWCQRGAMSVNFKKTQIQHFRSCSTPKTDHTFTFGSEIINVSDKYKQLGLVLTEHLDYDKTASIVANSAGRALGLLIAKFNAYGGLPYDCYKKLYDSLV